MANLVALFLKHGCFTLLVTLSYSSHYTDVIMSTMTSQNSQRLDCSLNLLFRRRSKKTLKLRVTGLCVGNSPVTGEFPAQRASNVENVSIWWRHHEACRFTVMCNIIVSLIPTHWGRDKMGDISQTTFSHAFSCMKIYGFCLRFQLSFFPRFLLTIFRHCFR